MKSQNDRIVDWNIERNLIKTPKDLSVENDMSYILEEVIESMTNLKSKEARVYAQLISKCIRRGNVKYLAELISYNSLDSISGENLVQDLNPENVVDACADIIVYATGTIRKSGYNPEIVMDEVLTQIESRTGSIIDNKFVKDTDEIKFYSADINKAKL